MSSAWRARLIYCGTRKTVWDHGGSVWRMVPAAIGTLIGAGATRFGASSEFASFGFADVRTSPLASLVLCQPRKLMVIAWGSFEGLLAWRMSSFALLSRPATA